MTENHDSFLPDLGFSMDLLSAGPAHPSGGDRQNPIYRLIISYFSIDDEPLGLRSREARVSAGTPPAGWARP
jgi:hypothetical protein